VRHHKLIVAGIDAKAPDEAQQHLRTRLSGNSAIRRDPCAIPGIPERVRKAGGIRAARARGLQTEGRKRILTETAAFGASLCAGQQGPANLPARASRGKPLILLILFQTNG
jgi:hypothetical protein